MSCTVLGAGSKTEYKKGNTTMDPKLNNAKPM
eukprot:CAMPEP_0172655882 /NCGR_PEP_ID=MMETSP1074-20121228/979_1 /TAXON_ID=2916 /ORGANISM="Ceratium fusus, Strain PA161109" /LENGTH=31 /DNA_ID= /DNA_START= /DNA_END= /DNA_ORIENTATION=